MSEVDRVMAGWLPGRRGVLAAGIGLLASGGVAAAPVTAGRRMSEAQLARVVCIGGAITEILYALDQSRRIVAVDSTSQYPPVALKEKRSIGYMRAVSAEGVLSVRPSLVLVMRDAGPPQALDVLSASPTPLLFVDATPSAEAVLGRVRTLADVFGVAARGEALCATIRTGFADLAAWRKAHPAGKRVLFLLSMQNGRPMVAGSGTAADAIIALAGGVNAASTLQGYKPVSDEAVAAMAPDVVLAMDHAGPGIDASALDAPAFQLTPAGRRHALIRMDGEYLLGLGPRTPAAALELAKRLASV